MTDEEKRILQGEEGEPPRISMQILSRLGEVSGADRMIAIASAHLVGCSYQIAGEAGIEIYRKLVNQGARVAVHTTLDPGSIGTPGIFLEAVRNRVAPSAIVNVKSEPMIIVCALLAEVFFSVEIPVVDDLDVDPLEAIRSGDTVRIDGRAGTIEVRHTVATAE